MTSKAKWCETEQDSDNWEELQLPPGHKGTLASQMEWHLDNRKRSTEAFSFDFIKGKGAAQVCNYNFVQLLTEHDQAKD